MFVLQTLLLSEGDKNHTSANSLNRMHYVRVSNSEEEREGTKSLFDHHVT